MIDYYATSSQESAAIFIKPFEILCAENVFQLKILQHSGYLLSAIFFLNLVCISEILNSLVKCGVCQQMALILQLC